MTNLFYAGAAMGLAASVVAVPAQVQAQVSPEHVAALQMVNNSVMSSDGRYVAFTKVVPMDPLKDNVPSQVHLYILDRATGIAKPYFTASSVSQVKFIPGTNKLSFLTRGHGDKANALYEISPDGGAAQQLFAYSSSIINYDWAPDGKRLVFTYSVPAEKPKTPLNYQPKFYEEDFDTRVAAIVSLDNPSSVRNISVKGSVYALSWSPNGKKIAITVAPTSSVDDSYMEQKIKVADANTGHIIAEVNNIGKFNHLVWSPDSRQLAYLGAYDLNDPTDGTLFVVSAEGGTPRRIDEKYKGKYEQIAWVNQDRIHYLASEGAATVLGEIYAHGWNNGRVLHRAEEAMITTFSVNKSGSISYTANTPTHPTELFVLEGRKSKRITHSNPQLEGLKMGKQEVIRYMARDGAYEIEGMLIYPIDYMPGRRYPLIVVVHGGPESHYSNGWLTNYSSPGQMGAAEGYMVFYPNYRGSTGRGQEFTYSSQNDPAGKEFDDVVDGVDYLIDKGLVDGNRVGVTGGSYGGYATAWMSTYYSDRFAAGVMFVGISNTLSKFGTSDIPMEMYHVHERQHIWENWERQLKRSPIYYVDRAQTPLLIMHGAEDPRVHPTQSMELYRHMKVRKPEVPVRLIFYPGEGHGNARSGSRYDYNLRMMQWFDIYLKSGNRKADMPSLDLPVK